MNLQSSAPAWQALLAIGIIAVVWGLFLEWLDGKIRQRRMWREIEKRLQK